VVDDMPPAWAIVGSVPLICWLWLTPVFAIALAISARRGLVGRVAKALGWTAVAMPLAMIAIVLAFPHAGDGAVALILGYLGPVGLTFGALLALCNRRLVQGWLLGLAAAMACCTGSMLLIYAVFRGH
jgi:hypothetical protein